MKSKDQDSFRRKAERSNRIAQKVISLGGYGVMVSIVLILLFLFYQSLPLSFKASLKNIFTVDLKIPHSETLLTGVDQYLELAYLLDNGGRVRFYSFLDKTFTRQDSLPLQKNEKILCASKGRLNAEVFAVGTNRGRILTAEVKMLPRYQNNQRTVIPTFTFIDSFSIGAFSDSLPSHVENLVFRINEDGVRFWAWLNHQGALHLKINDPEMEETYQFDLSRETGEQKITALAMDHAGERLIVGSLNGELFRFDMSDFEDVVLRDNWKAGSAPISALAFLLGDNALIVGDAEGGVSEWFPVRDARGQFKYRFIRGFEQQPAAVTRIFVSPRNRTFMTIDARGNIQLDYSTTGRTLVTFPGHEQPIRAGAIAPKSNAILLVDRQNNLGFYKLNTHHPEATLKTLFGKVWYEGYPKPEFVWQSTGGSDEFESKLSLVPLIFGTLKGTLYAMIFSIPLALLAAVYVSQFSPNWLARTVKPTVEIMAALPSVVIGFLAGLYFSPLFEKYLTAVFLVSVLIPILLLIGIVIWRMVPEHRRLRVSLGWELLYITPFLILAFVLAFWLAKPVEVGFFGGHFQQWIYNVFHVSYDQRNSLVVGFALGFAVVPIIFTISEDALSNVPKSLTSASLALGASRWQTVRRVVLPAAAGGIFAAVMLGLGRAIGETMIVLMATGNTPILDLSPFNGFRAMSACIAVEIPEAPVGGTLYRVLFLTAFLLFLFTFVINSLAAFIGDRLRKKYARF